MDRLRRGHFCEQLTGRIFLSHFDAMSALAPELTAATAAQQENPTPRAPADEALRA
jgi:SulP family sulfate permease